jgi:hypothetical protein
MNYDPPPWGSAKGADRVKAIKKFIQEDKSSWERKDGVRMIWNGADENAHDSQSCGLNPLCQGQRMVNFLTEWITVHPNPYQGEG